MSQIQIHFHDPGNWGDFTLTSLWQDAEGYACRKYYQPNEIPVEYQGTLSGIVASIVGLEEPWQAEHVVAELKHETQVLEIEDGDGEYYDAETLGDEFVALTVNARRMTDNASKQFTYNDYAALKLTEADGISMFKSLANVN